MTDAVRRWVEAKREAAKAWNTIGFDTAQWEAVLRLVEAVEARRKLEHEPWDDSAGSYLDAHTAACNVVDAALAALVGEKEK